jgi:hypothetical protein
VSFFFFFFLEEGDALLTFWYSRLFLVKQTTLFLSPKVVLSCWKVGHESTQNNQEKVKTMKLRQSVLAFGGMNKRQGKAFYLYKDIQGLWGAK